MKSKKFKFTVEIETTDMLWLKSQIRTWLKKLIENNYAIKKVKVK